MHPASPPHRVTRSYFHAFRKTSCARSLTLEASSTLRPTYIWTIPSYGLYTRSINSSCFALVAASVSTAGSSMLGSFWTRGASDAEGSGGGDSGGRGGRVIGHIPEGRGA